MSIRLASIDPFKPFSGSFDPKESPRSPKPHWIFWTAAIVGIVSGLVTVGVTVARALGFL